MKNLLAISTLIFLCFACGSKLEPATLAIINAKVYTVDQENPHTDAIAIKGDKIIALGSDVAKYIDENTQVIDAQGQFTMPGLIESHGHFSNFGRGLQNLNFLNIQSWQEIVSMVEKKVKETPKGEWIYGRGWHQEKWIKAPEQSYGGYPLHYTLSQISPDNPVILFHASGHAVYANEAAMMASKVNIETPDPLGGKIIRDQQGNAIGVFEENALELISEAYDEYQSKLNQEQLDSIWYAGINLAQNECLKYGITSFQDAGSKFYELERYQALSENNNLDIRLWVMVRHSSTEMEGKLNQYRYVNEQNAFYTCRAVKSELDGALGAHGAWLHKAYADKHGFMGQNTTTIEELSKIARQCHDAQMQLCVHAIGDKANHETLNIFEEYASLSASPLRWRIEHAQHLIPEDIPRFKTLGAIASMQGIHCTSDAPFVVKRLGIKRSNNGAYIWRDLIDSGAIIANGTDVPVESINPFECLFASITRKRIDSGLEFFPQKSMTRAEAIASYTINGAYAAFQEKTKGSIEVGKLADIIILDQDLMLCNIKDLPRTKVLKTIVGGQVKYEI